MTEHPLINFQNIEKLFANKTILHNLNLKIYKNEIIALLGKSGCGKSTLLKILIGFYPPDHGSIYYKGRNLTGSFVEIRKITGFVSQENSFYEKLSVEENLNFFAKLYSVPKKNIKSRIDVLLDLVKLEHARHMLADKISGGMKRRLEFAISLIHDPQILILDEPFTGLDIKIREELWEVLEKIQKSGVTIIISSHLLTSIQKHVSRVVILNNYSIVEDFTLSENMGNGTRFNLEEKFLDSVK